MICKLGHYVLQAYHTRADGQLIQRCGGGGGEAKCERFCCRSGDSFFIYIYKTAIMPSTCCFVFWMDMFMFQSAVSWTPDKKKFEFPGEVL